MNGKFRIKNKFGEELDTLVEGKGDAQTTVVFVHGWGTDKHETLGLFDDIAGALAEKYRTVRFDFSGCGESEGQDLDADYFKYAEDLEAVLTWVRKNFSGEIFVLAMSMGCFVACLLAPEKIGKTVLLSIPNTNMDYIIEQVKQKILTRGGTFAENGITVYPRTSGQVQKYSAKFWKTMREFVPVMAVKNMAEKTKLYIIHPRQDEIVGNVFLDEYKSIPRVTFIELDGSHGFLDLRERRAMIQRVKEFFAN